MPDPVDSPAVLPPFGDRPLPHSDEAERAVLCCLLRDAHQVADTVLAKLQTDDAFFGALNRRIYGAVRELCDAGKAGAVDPISIGDHLIRGGRGDEDTLIPYLAELVSVVPTSANVEYYAECVLNTHILRRMIQACDEISDRCYGEDTAVEDLVDDIETQVLGITKMRLHNEVKPLKPLVVDALKFLDRLNRKEKDAMGIPTDFPDLDNLITGLRGGELIILAARPSIGKTTLALNIACNVALHAGVPTGVFSLEMGGEQLAQRLLCSEAKVNIRDVRDGKLTREQWNRDLFEAGNRLMKAPIFVDDTPQLTSVELRQKTRRMHQDHNIGFIVVDYLQLMRPTGSNPNANREQEVAKISRELKGLARELDIPVMVLAQLNRQAETTGGRPKLAHLRESGAIEQDADVVALLHREREVETDKDRAAIEAEGMDAELIIAKNRNGETGIVPLLFFPQWTQFKNRSRMDAGDLAHVQED